MVPFPLRYSWVLLPLRTTRCRYPRWARSKQTRIPLVFLTSNNTRELSEALKRRCLFLHLDYPSVAREREIVLTKVEGIEESLADQVVRTVKLVRTLELKKSPSVSETLDWARTLVLLGVSHLDTATARQTLNVLLKHQADIDRAAKELVAARE